MRVVTDWGYSGLKAVQEQADLVIIVDILSFSTCVDVACGRGAFVYPFPFGDRVAAEEEAHRLGAILAGRRIDPDARFTLSAQTLTDISEQTRLLLPSPNGSRLSRAAGSRRILAGCLRNADAVARAANQICRNGTVAVIAAGELWPDKSLRPAIEDWLGAGAIISALKGSRTPEAQLAGMSYENAREDLSGLIWDSESGRELREKGFAGDVELALALNVSRSVPELIEGCYRA